MNNLPFANKIPGWQRERAAKLHRACLSLQTAIQNGEALSHALPRVARNFTGRAYKSDSSKRFRLSAGTLKHQFKAWKRGGESSAAFSLKYTIARPRIPGAMLVRFVDFCACLPHGSMKDAWLKFYARERRRFSTAQALKISLGQVYYSFPVSAFYQLQGELKKITAAQKQLAALRLGMISDIRARLPDRVTPRHPEYEI